MIAFLTVDSPTASALSPMESAARAAGARLEERGGWRIAVAFGSPSVERARIERTVGFADRSHIRKLELHGPAAGLPGAPQPLALGRATRGGDGAWWCPVTPERTLVIGGEWAAPAGAADLTCAYAALELMGPACRELLARFCAIDVRPSVMPVGAFRPGSVARTPGYVLRTGENALLVLVGWALGEYLWEVVADAAGNLGGGPIGEDTSDA